MQEKQDLELVEELRQGNEQAFEEIIERYSTKAYSLALRFTQNRQDAEEVLQDVFSTVYRKVDAFEGKSAFSSWLYRVTVNTALMRIRKSKSSRMISIEDVSNGTGIKWSARISEEEPADEATYRSQLRKILEQEIKELPAEYLPTFILRDIKGLSNREVSQVLDISIPAVKSRLHRARLILRRRLKTLFLSGEQGELELWVSNG